jgi:TetR/AcrR family transcriptional repressor of nem operon
MARTREFNPETVLDAALDLFWRKGYKACSMADVVRKSGVARYGVYQTFKDKDQLYCATLKRYHQKLHDFFVKPFCGKKSDYQSLVAHFDRVLNQLENGEHDGCFAHQAAIERAGVDANVDKIVNHIFDETKQAYRYVLKNGLAAGQIRDLPLDDLVVYVMGIQRALIAMTKQRCSLRERQRYVRCALKLLEP